MAFQRSYSKVWWGSDSISTSSNYYIGNNNNNNNVPSTSSVGGNYLNNMIGGISNVYNQNNSGFHSLDSHHNNNNNNKYSGNLSRIQEVEENSKLWKSHDSPGSLRSQDSGFSDHDDSNSRSTSKTSSPRKSEFESPVKSLNKTETPPTVIRRKPSDISPTRQSARRISYSAPTSPAISKKELSTSTDLINQIDKLSFTPKNHPNDIFSDDSLSHYKYPAKDSLIRRRRVNKRPRRATNNRYNSQESSSEEMDASGYDHSDKFNETAYIGANGFVKKSEILDASEIISPKVNACSTPNVSRTESKTFPEIFNHNTSYLIAVNGSNTSKLNESIGTYSKLIIPIGYDSQDELENIKPHNVSKSNYRYRANAKTKTQPFDSGRFSSTTPDLVTEYENPLLNGHPLCLMSWLSNLQMKYDHEVMSTLQTKSIAQEAFRNLKITTNTVAKIIRQLQCSAIQLHKDFDKLEKILHSMEGTIATALTTSMELVRNVGEFVRVLERRSVFFTECREDRKKFDNNIENIHIIIKDLSYSLEQQHYLDIETLLEDIQVLKRLILITLRLVFEKLVRILIINIENNAKCDLMLRANLNMIATLSNCDYQGFASLSEAFVKNHAERVLLLICVEHKLSSVRALSLRALATICVTSESIEQFTRAGGIDIIKDILLVNDEKRTEPEKREAVSLLTQITASWHGDEHKVMGLKDAVENLVDGITDIIGKTNCCQTLLLCAASLNNLSRLEGTAVYSIMSNEAIIKLKDVVENRGPCVSIFLYEQIVTLLYNMSLNKKCHNHLANRNLINFITYIFQLQFYKKYDSRAESNAHRKTIKTILHIFNVLINESLLGQEILENNFIPIFSKVEKDLMKNSFYDYGENLNEYTKDISYLNNKLNESLSNKSFNRTSTDAAARNLSTNTTTTTKRYESYV